MLCVVDSDRDYIGGKRGETCRQAEKVFRRLANTVGLLYVTNSKEKENLFPFTLYAENSIDKKPWVDSIINSCKNEETLRYVDIKDGIKFKRLEDKIFVEKYEDLLDNIKINRLCEAACVDESNEYCIKGIGSSLLKTASDSFFEKNSYKITSDSTKFNKIFGLQSFIINDWKEISQHIYDYGCCLLQSTRFNV